MTIIKGKEVKIIEVFKDKAIISYEEIKSVRECNWISVSSLSLVKRVRFFDYLNSEKAQLGT